MGADYPTCDPGLYATKGLNPLSQIKETYCEPCPLGYFCPGGSKRDGKPQPCPDGYFGTAIGRAEQGDACTRCPEGSYCKKGAAYPTRCGPGTFSPPAASECSICNAGTYCPGNTGEAKQCEPGYYALNQGMDYCVPCEPGHFCKYVEGMGLIPPEVCDEGTYQDEPAQTECKACPDTHFCPEGATTGHYCHGGKFLDSTTGLCAECLAGHFCAVGEQMAICEAGTFAEAGSELCSICPEGHFCVEGSHKPVLCDREDKCKAGSKKNRD